MPKRVPITAAARQVVVLAYDGDRIHVVTYGVTKKVQAAKSWIMSALKSPVPIEPPTFSFPDEQASGEGRE